MPEMADSRPSLIGFMPPREDQRRLVAKTQTERLKPQRDPDTRDDLPSQDRPKPIPARDEDYYSPWG